MTAALAIPASFAKDTSMPPKLRRYVTMSVIGSVLVSASSGCWLGSTFVCQIDRVDLVIVPTRVDVGERAVAQASIDTTIASGPRAGQTGPATGEWVFFVVDDPDVASVEPTSARARDHDLVTVAVVGQTPGRTGITAVAGGVPSRSVPVTVTGR